jgi:menaquinone-dependent protoporphyrinogen oxidase
MTVLIAYASRHASTGGIAERVAAELRRLGHEVDVRAVDEAVDVGRYDAFVIGSAVYYSRWLRPAVEFVRRHRATLAERPVWLFSSGSLGADSGPYPDPVRELLDVLRACDHREFGGALERDRLGPVEGLIARMVKAPEGDFRRWAEIDAWAHEIGGQLAGTRTEVARR